MGYLRSGDASAFAFNQMASFQPFNVTWWDEGTSWVGLTLGSPAGKAAQDQSAAPFDSPWSFYRLLKSAASFKNRVATWAVPVDDTRRKTTPIGFELSSDPWAIVAVTAIGGGTPQ